MYFNAAYFTPMLVKIFQLEAIGMVCSCSPTFEPLYTARRSHMMIFLPPLTDPYHQELYDQYGEFLPILNNGSNPGE